MHPPLPHTVLKNVEAGPVKTAIVVTFCMNLILAYEVMLIPPREYVERWLVTPSRPYHKCVRGIGHVERWGGCG